MGRKLINNFPANRKHLYNIYTTSAQRLRRWSNIVEMSYECFVFTGLAGTGLRGTFSFCFSWVGKLSYPIYLIQHLFSKKLDLLKTADQHSSFDTVLNI